jgi:3-oxoacyl-[acyl-carrier protein] reductase
VALGDAHPPRRPGLPADVAAGAVFLATKQPSWITGSILDVSGGAVMV